MNRHLCLGLALLAACAGDPTGTSGEGAVRATISVDAGGTADTNGFILKIGNWSVPIENTGGSVTLPGIQAGTRALTLVDVASWCSTLPATVNVNIAAGDTTDAQITVHCSAAPALPARVIIRTVGVDLDQDGYILTAHGNSFPVAPQDTVELPLQDSETVEISGIVGRCGLVPTRAVAFRPAGGSRTMTISISCGLIVADVWAGSTGADQGEVLSLLNFSGEVYGQVLAPNRGGYSTSDLAWSHDGSRIAVASWFGHPLILVDPVTRDSVVFPTITYLWGVSWAPGDSVLALGTPTKGVISFVSTSGASMGTLPGTPVGGFDYFPAYSPDGTKLAFIGQSGRVSDSNYSVSLFVVPTNGGSRTNLVQGIHPNGPPRWSPGGSFLLFTRGVIVQDTMQTSVWRVNADGSGLQQLTFPPGVESDDSPEISNDGSTVIFVRHTRPDYDFHLMSIPPTGGAPTPFSNSLMIHGAPRFRP